MLNESQMAFLERAINLSRRGMQERNGGPFGCVIAKNREILGEGCNMVLATNDPTAHAEIVAIRMACKALNSFQLSDCEIYASCEPCPMCLGAIYWARPRLIVYANSRHDAARIEFDDELIYNEMKTDILQRKIPFIHHPHPMAMKVFEEWERMEGKLKY